MHKTLVQIIAVVLLACIVMPNARADELQTVFRQLLQNPDDVALNLRYARLAEKRGETRKALAAYERAVAADPGNAEARAGLQRIRVAIEPSVTRLRLELGGLYQDNARELPSALGRPDDVQGVARFYLFDQRGFLNQIWRSRASGYFDAHKDISTIDYWRVRGFTGPLFDLGNGTKLHVGVGGAIAWLDGRHYYNEAGTLLTLENLFPGLIDNMSARFVYRDVNRHFSANNAFEIEVSAVQKHRNVLNAGDSLYLIPSLRWREPDSNSPGGPLVIPSRFFPGDFIEFGARLHYYQPLSGNIVLGGNFRFYYRDYDQSIRSGTKDRSDWQISPGVDVQFRNVLCRGCEIHTEYRYVKNYSNDPTERFDNHIIGGKIVKRY